jgi:hypothetical protein
VIEVIPDSTDDRDALGPALRVVILVAERRTRRFRRRR